MPDIPPPHPPRPATPSPLLQAIAALANRRSLSETQATDVFGAVMRGEATAAQIAALLMGLRVKGETPEEVAGAARARSEERRVGKECRSGWAVDREKK